MIVEEEQNKHMCVDLPTMLCDDVICPKIDPSLPNKSFVMLIVGDKGSGKTSLTTSLLTSKKKGSKAYRGKFEDIMLSMPKSSLRSIKGDPFGGLSEGNVFDEFDEEFLNAVVEKAEENSEEGFRTLILIDDASSSLKTNKAIIDKFTKLVHRHRHLGVSVILLIQSLVSCPLSVRKNVDSLVYFKPSNEKSNTIFKDEYLGDFSREEARMLFNYVFQQKGDFLMLKIEPPTIKYYRKFNRLNISRD